MSNLSLTPELAAIHAPMASSISVQAGLACTEIEADPKRTGAARPTYAVSPGGTIWGGERLSGASGS